MTRSLPRLLPSLDGMRFPPVRPPSPGASRRSDGWSMFLKSLEDLVKRTIPVLVGLGCGHDSAVYRLGSTNGAVAAPGSAALLIPVTV